jgi:hypothetical protein
MTYQEKEAALLVLFTVGVAIVGFGWVLLFMFVIV